MVTRAKKLILGMPKRSVQILSNKIPELQTEIDFRKKDMEENPILKKSIIPTNLQELMESTKSMPAIKIIMNFTKNWWDPSKYNPE